METHSVVRKSCSVFGHHARPILKDVINDHADFGMLNDSMVAVDRSTVKYHFIVGELKWHQTTGDRQPGDVHPRDVGRYDALEVCS